jgi:hypothetical protein
MLYLPTMYKWLKSLYGLPSLLLHSLSGWTGGARLVAFTALLVLTGCSGTPLSLLTGGGPNVAANTQIGRENTQTVGQDKRFQPEVRTESPIETVEQSSNDIRTGAVENIQVTNIPPWVILLLIIGWLLPSPGEMGRSIASIFRRRT